MISRAAIIMCARTYIGTPFHHGGRAKHYGLDCGGLIAGVLKELGVPHTDAVHPYTRFPDGNTLQAIMDASLNPTCDKCAGPGDVLGFYFDRPGILQHVGFKTNKGILHVYQGGDKCVESSLSKRWQKRLMLAWKVPDVEPKDDFDVTDLTDLSDPLRYVERSLCCG